MKPIAAVVQQHCDVASVLWLRRDRLSGEPHLGLDELARLDRQLEAHLDGLRIAGEVGWQTAVEALRWRDPDELFPAAVLAWESGVAARIEEVASCARESHACWRALVSSLGWLSDESAAPHIERLLASGCAFERHLGLAACAIRRRDPKDALAAALAGDDGPLRARALRAIGELGRVDLLQAVEEALDSPDENLRAWAAWSSARLGGGQPALDVLKQAVESQSPLAGHALQLVLRRMEPAEAARWLNHLAADRGFTRAAVVGAGIIGTPDAIAWLLDRMATPVLARVAGEAFTMITGVDLAATQLEARRPEGFTAGPTEDPADDNVDLDPDENLSWPDRDGLARWWAERGERFVAGTRYLCGRPMEEPWLEEVLAGGYQRQRMAAALELALWRRDRPLFNTSAPGHRQQELLGLRKPELEA